MYPIAMLYSEHSRVVKRSNGRLATEGVIMQAVVVSALSGGDHFKKLLKELTDG